MSTTNQSAIVRTLWTSTGVISKHLDNSLGAVHGIGLTEYMVLLSLSEAPNQSLRRIDIAEALSRTASGITRLLMPMEKIGLVEKQANERDARVSLVKLTSTGESLLKNATVTFEKKAETLLKNLTDKQTSSLLNLLTNI
ncbi:MarR family winged helix-turn-helix transcriptional regulator [Glaciecola sp. 1036]|uniref:MarR family winged helix-turn-helix transcriptional regulator n=1 Tax=Alteromonadaceae TaxID=72275 RepID=UPI003D01A405